MKINNLVKAIISIFLITIIYYLIDFEQVLNSIINFNILFILPIIVCFIILFITGALNFKILLDPFEKLPFFKLLKYYSFSWAMSFLTPGRIGELSIIYSITKNSKIKTGQASAIFLINKVITFFILSLSAIAVLLLFLKFESTSTAIAAIVGLWMIATIILSKQGRNFIKKNILKKHAEKLIGFSKTISYYWKNQKHLLALNFLITILNWGMQAMIAWLILLGLGVETNYFTIYAISTSISIISFIPFTFNGIGPREFLFITLTGKIGVAAATAGATTALSLAFNYLIFF